MTDSQAQGFNWSEFSKKTWVVIASIIFFPPLGLILLWRHPVLGKQRNWWIGACVWGLLWVVNLNREAQNTNSAPESGSSAITNKNTGKMFSASEMKALYKKAKTLRLGMSEQEVLSLLGTPTKTSHTDYSKIDVPDSLRQAFPNMNPNPDPLDIYTWSLKSDPGNSFIMVSFQRGVIQDGSVHEGKSNKTFDLR